RHVLVRRHGVAGTRCDADQRFVLGDDRGGCRPQPGGNAADRSEGLKWILSGERSSGSSSGPPLTCWRVLCSLVPKSYGAMVRGGRSFGISSITHSSSSIFTCPAHWRDSSLPLLSQWTS